MEPALERRGGSRRRSGTGRRSTDREQQQEQGPQALRGLLHDLGHEMTTLSYLVESVRDDSSLREDPGFRLELLSAEMTRLLELIEHGMHGLRSDQGPEEIAEVDLASLAGQVTRLAGLAHDAEVTLLPGPGPRLEASPALLWRVLSNVVDNAARAAGRGGRVTVAISQHRDTVIEVTDDGPGFGSGPPGKASLGLGIVTSLLGSCGGTLETGSPPSGARGAVVRIVLPERMALAQARAPAGGE